ncbi:MAG: aldo/keto reductase [Cyanobacteria bacterium P01_C01_bin.70]
MDYYILGNSGLRVSQLALGTMTFGDDWGWGADDSVSRQIFDAYLEAGGNFFDSADMYTNGRSEAMLGKFIKDAGARDKAIIATKFSYNAEPGNPNAGGNSRKNIMRAVEGSLQRLGTDYIDLYILHTWDGLTPAEEVMRTFDDLVSSGKVRYVGLSDVPAWYAAEAQVTARFRGYEPITSIQMEYSLIERSIENEFVDLGAAHGMGITVWSPLASGLLSGKYKPSAGQLPEGEGRLITTAGSGNPAFEKFTDRNWGIVAELEKVARELDRSMAQVALNWVATQPGVASVLIGATKLHQLQDNLAALDFAIPADLRSRLDAASAMPKPFPYSFFGPELQGMLSGGATVGDKPSGYYRDKTVRSAGAGVGANVANA